MRAVGEETKTYRVRRVGTVTLGVTLLCYGVLFLTHIFVPSLQYAYIARCWPVVFILLGCEILWENRGSEKQACRVVYDFAAVIMLFLMLLFAMVMAACEISLQYAAACR